METAVRRRHAGQSPVQRMRDYNLCVTSSVRYAIAIHFVYIPDGLTLRFLLPHELYLLILRGKGSSGYP